MYRTDKTASIGYMWAFFIISIVIVIIFCLSQCDIGVMPPKEELRKEEHHKPLSKKNNQPIKKDIKQNRKVIKKDPLLKFFPANELSIVRKEAVENHCNGDLLYVLLAIRKAENGRAGLEFGVLHPKAKNTNLETQAGWAAATVAKNHIRWQNADIPDDFITFLGKRYCPVGVDNDPDGLNRNWIHNVKHWYAILHNLDKGIR